MIECLLESSPEETSPKTIQPSRSVSVPNASIDDDYVNLTLDTLTLSTKSTTKISPKTIEHFQVEYISMDEILRVCSSSLSRFVILMFVERFFSPALEEEETERERKGTMLFSTLLTNRTCDGERESFVFLTSDQEYIRHASSTKDYTGTDLHSTLIELLFFS